MAFALMLDSVRAIPARLAKEPFGFTSDSQPKIAAARALTLTTLQGLFLENRKQSQWRYKERKDDKHPEQEIIHRSI